MKSRPKEKRPVAPVKAAKPKAGKGAPKKAQKRVTVSGSGSRKARSRTSARRRYGKQKAPVQKNPPGKKRPVETVAKGKAKALAGARPAPPKGVVKRAQKSPVKVAQKSPVKGKRRKAAVKAAKPVAVKSIAKPKAPPAAAVKAPAKPAAPKAPVKEKRPAATVEATSRRRPRLPPNKHRRRSPLGPQYRKNR